jgi:hypothetical protein
MSLMLVCVHALAGRQFFLRELMHAELSLSVQAA